MTDIRGIYEYTQEELNTSLPKGTYCLSVSEGSVGEWDDGQLHLDLTTRVEGGEYDGQFGPRITWNVELEDRVVEIEGRESFTVNAEQSRKALRTRIDNIMDGQRMALPSTSWDRPMMEAIAKQIVGRKFVALVDEKNGWPNAKRIFPMSNPPKSYKAASGPAKTFSVEDI